MSDVPSRLQTREYSHSLKFAIEERSPELALGRMPRFEHHGAHHAIEQQHGAIDHLRQRHGYRSSVGAFEHHVPHDRPAHILGEVAECLIEPMLGERAANSAGIECHLPTVA